MTTSCEPAGLRDIVVASSAHDVLSAHHDRGFEDLDLLFESSSEIPMIPLVVSELNRTAHPPSSRALVFSDNMDFAIDRAMVLWMWNNRKRLLVPDAETTSAVWGKWRNIVDTAAIKGWGGWRIAGNPDSTRAHLSLEPCVTFLRNIRVPANSLSRCDGVSDNWRGRWDPCPHTADAIQSGAQESWVGFPTVDTDDSSYLCRGILSPEAETSLGCMYLLDCRHMWRPLGPCRDRILSYLGDVPDSYSKEGICALAIAGNQLIRQCGGVYPALVEFQENEMRMHADQLNFATENRDMFPVQYPAVLGILDQGVRAVYDKGVEKSPRARGLSYHPSSSEMVADKFWKDIRQRQFFV